nr:TerD family protein [Pedobacter gandavensis]
MAINLQKGQRENLKAPKFTVGLGWDTNSSASGQDFDLDASVFMIGEWKFEAVGVGMKGGLQDYVKTNISS